MEKEIKPEVEAPEVEEEIVEEEVEVSEEIIEKLARKIESKLYQAPIVEKVEVKDLGEMPQTEIEESAAKKTFNYIKGMLNGTVKTSDQVVGAMDTADTSEVLPLAEFSAEVQRLETQYGVALRDANVRRTTRRSVLVNKKESDVVVYDTGEGAAKTVTHMDFEQIEITLKKYAAIVPLSDELLEDSIVDLYAELTNSFARAFAKVADELVFTNATSGLLLYSGVNEIVLTAADGLHDVTFDDLNDMIYAIPADALPGAKFYMHRSVLSAIQKIKDLDNHYIWTPGPNGIIGGSIWGYPYELVEVMPAATAGIIAQSTSFLLFGNLKYTTLLERTGIQLFTMKEGTVGEINLGEQDVTALRAVKRFNAKPVFANAFSRLKTNTTIS